MNIPSPDEIEQRMLDDFERGQEILKAPSYHIDHVERKANFTYFGNDLVLEFICEGIADTPIRLIIEPHVVTTMHRVWFLLGDYVTSGILLLPENEHRFWVGWGNHDGRRTGRIGA